MPRIRARRTAVTDPEVVAVSSELFAPVSADVELCYQTYGDPDAEPLLLVMGLGAPMTWWDPALCTLLARQGFYVIRYDNRDAARSSSGTARITRSMLIRAFLGRKADAPYAIADLAEDAFGLLDHLGIDSAHVVGVSMGGMIVQSMAIAEGRNSGASRVRSLVSIMSTTGRRTAGWQDPRILPMLLGPRATTKEGYVAAARTMGGLIGSPGYPEPEAASRARAEETFERGINAAGTMRQMMAVLTQPDRGRALGSVRVPAAVIHGMDDRMVHPSGGRATAQAIPGAHLLLIPGMGHDLPVPLHETFVDVIRRTADKAQG
ncbi:alpha/beta fold hydrolase [Nocardioides marmoriginsengisoli]|uniref:Alpha/beta fold hydrolase n=1 Tax=Nocardioides marmoriginsengisoli TaxID=661483 RepID=A0A3N0CE99_9ACTN|nr:alpha/beta fold hydrolase [Nocardioides marmoriginsengisoli]RNL61333.1 alpha/beta fold hydrolase [Nocardioides marmoriginsengisoli]